MKVLIVAWEKAEVKDFLEKTIKGAYRGTTVKKLDWGIIEEPEPGMNPAVLDAGGFDLIIYHCGAGNEEYGEFITTYRELSGREGWQDPAFVLFTGGTNIKSVAVLYEGDPKVCVVTSSELNKYFDSFLRALRQIDESGEINRLPCHALRGLSKNKLALPVLHALLPFGRIYAKDYDARGLRECILESVAHSGLEGLIAMRMYEHLECALTPLWDVKGYERDINLISAMIASLSDQSKQKQKWRIRKKTEVPRTLDGAISLLASSDNVSEWNLRLSALRDILLG